MIFCPMSRVLGTAWTSGPGTSAATHEARRRTSHIATAQMRRATRPMTESLWLCAVMMTVRSPWPYQGQSLTQLCDQGTTRPITHALSE